MMIYTIGHSNRTPADLLDGLHRHAITRVVDVRSHPVSRHVPHFNKQPLAAFLTAHAIDYHFAGQQLGGRPADASVWQAGRVDYLQVMERDWYRNGIQRLLELAAEQPLAIMCSEGDPYQCHRHHLIACSLLDPVLKFIDIPVQIKHILRDNTSVSVSPEDFLPGQPRLLS